jgi:AraC family transcriptional regulator, regulatory protein of adaptative response / methylated-DNA-[protein]-cysteine methyltransferase
VGLSAVTSVGEKIDDGDAWAAVAARDRRYDGRFVYAVRTTGVYCRPSCPSRRPAPANVVFYDDAADAERAGFRACKRCQPRAKGAVTGAAAAVRGAAAFIDAHVDERITLATLARQAGLSPFHLQRVFRRELGVTPREYQQARRLDRLRAQLRRGETVSRATYEAGFGSPSRVYEQAGPRLGMTPAVYRRGGEGLRIRFAIVLSPLGHLLVAASQNGICAVSLGDNHVQLEQRLRDEFPRAVIEPGEDGPLATLAGRVLAHIRGEGPAHDLPLDVRGTAFQQLVWRTLLAIPYGETRSYAQIAAAIGQPTAMRAVAQACAANPVAIVIPCHRVVRSDGGLGGYAGGVERKERLLAIESGAQRTTGDRHTSRA